VLWTFGERSFRNPRNAAGQLLPLFLLVITWLKSTIALSTHPAILTQFAGKVLSYAMLENVVATLRKVKLATVLTVVGYILYILSPN